MTIFLLCILAKITENRCTASIDVGFIVDSSGSLRSEYSKEKDFVSQVVEGFGISRSGTKAGLVLFSRNAELCVKFDQFNNVADFQNAVDNLPLMGMTTRIDKALKVAYDQLFSTENGMRPKTPKVVILLTDGEQTQDADAIAPSLAVMPFHEAGIKVMVVGIGSGVKPAELASIVKSPSNLYFAKDFDQLKSKKFVEDIIDDSCKNLSKMMTNLLISSIYCLNV